MVKGKKFSPQRKSNFIPVNNRIRAPEVRCIDAEGNNIGVVPINQALRIAGDSNLDLVQIAKGQDGIPICRVTDYGKFKYDMSKRQKETAKKQRESATKTKEIKFRPSTDTNDLQVKATKAIEILDNGDRVKVSIMFKGREITHREVGIDALSKFLALVPNGQFLGQPSIQGRILSAIIDKREVKAAS